MGIGGRIARKAVRKSVPRSVRRAAHPVRTVKNAVTPRPVHTARRAVSTVTNPLGTVENMIVDGLFSSPGKGRRRTGTRPTATGTRTPPSGSSGTADLRAAQGTAANQQLAALMAVQKERFTPPQRPAVAAPIPADVAAFERQEWAQLKHGTPPWRRTRRRELRLEAAQRAAHRAAEQNAQSQARYQVLSAQAEAWWAALHRGQVDVVIAALDAAFADNPAPVTVRRVRGTEASLVVLLPRSDVLPTKKAHVTPTGKQSSKAWTKTEFNEVYSDLLGAHLLATVRETWVTAPSLTRVHVTGVRRSVDGVEEQLFDLTLDRAGAPWDNDTYGSVLLRAAPGGLNRVGKTREIRPLPHK